MNFPTIQECAEDGNHTVAALARDLGLRSYTVPTEDGGGMVVQRENGSVARWPTIEAARSFYLGEKNQANQGRRDTSYDKDEVAAPRKLPPKNVRRAFSRLGWKEARYVGTATHPQVRIGHRVVSSPLPCHIVEARNAFNGRLYQCRFFYDPDAMDAGTPWHSIIPGADAWECVE